MECNIIDTGMFSKCTRLKKTCVTILNTPEKIQIRFTHNRLYRCHAKIIILIIWDSEDIKEKCLEDNNTLYNPIH